MTVLTPRPMPERRPPVAAGGTVVALAAPIFFIAGWRVQGWMLGAVLWAGSQLLGLVFARVGIHEPSLRGSGIVAFGMMFRAVGVMVVVIAVAASDAELGVAAALLYALAYTLELTLSLVAYFGAPAR